MDFLMTDGKRTERVMVAQAVVLNGNTTLLRLESVKLHPLRFVPQHRFAPPSPCMECRCTGGTCNPMWHQCPA
jgi:hypothetical protein